MNDLETRLRDAFAARAALVTPDSLRRDLPPGGRRRIGRWAIPTVAGLAVAATVAGVLIAGGSGRNRAEPPSHPSPGVNSMTGAQLRRSLGAAVARQGSGHIDGTIDHEPGVETIDFVVHDGDVDFVDESDGGRIVAKNGVVVSSFTAPMSVDHPPPNLEIESFVPAVARALRELTFQQPGRKEEHEQIPGDAVFSRAGTTDDGSTVWTSSWTSPEKGRVHDEGARLDEDVDGPGEDLAGGAEKRDDVRLVVDAAGLPVEFRRTVTWLPNAAYTHAPEVRVIRYSRWGQPVQVPEPTPFGTPSTAPTSPGTSPPPPEPSPSPSPS